MKKYNIDDLAVSFLFGALIGLAIMIFIVYYY